MNNLRLPTMKQLSRMGGDAAPALDYIESELERAYRSIPKVFGDYAKNRKRIRDAIRRVQKRRKEYFGK